MWGAIAAGGLGLASQWMANEANKDIAAGTTAANFASAREQMQFQKEMMTEQYYRRRVGLEQAGYNPMLEFSAGSSVPTGSSAQAVGAEVKPLDFGGLTSNALASRRLEKDVEQADQSIKVDQALEAKAKADTETAHSSAKKIATEEKILKAQMPAIKQEAQLREKRAGYDKEWTKADSWIDRTKKGASALSEAIGGWANKLLRGSAGGSAKQLPSGSREMP